VKTDAIHTGQYKPHIGCIVNHAQKRRFLGAISIVDENGQLLSCSKLFDSEYCRRRPHLSRTVRSRCGRCVVYMDRYTRL